MIRAAARQTNAERLRRARLAVAALDGSRGYVASGSAPDGYAEKFAPEARKLVQTIKDFDPSMVPAWFPQSPWAKQEGA